VQLPFHSWEAFDNSNLMRLYKLRQAKEKTMARIHFLEGLYRFPKRLKLEA